MRYVALDGDQIGRRLELLILQDDDDAAAALSAAVKAAVGDAATQLANLGFEIVFAGGDSVLAKTPEFADISTLRLQYESLSFSVGTGASPSEALISLMQAKIGKHPTCGPTANERVCQ